MAKKRIIPDKIRLDDFYRNAPDKIQISPSPPEPLTYVRGFLFVCRTFPFFIKNFPVFFTNAIANPQKEWYNISINLIRSIP